MDPTNRKIQALVDMFLSRELLLPEMQRKYVWNATQARNLLDSIYRDYPSGSILIWETDNIPELKKPSFGKTSQEPIGKRLLLLDGQQRITTLVSILTGEAVRIRKGTAVKETFVDVYFNIDHPEDDAKETEELPDFEVGDVILGKWTDGEFYSGKISEIDGKRYKVIYDDGDAGWTDEVMSMDEEEKKELFFQIKNKRIEHEPNWISVTKLFKEGVGSILKDLKIGYDHPNFEKYNSRLNTLYGRKDNYLYPIQIIRDKGYSEVTDIFIRVNSSGTRLRGSDLALAQITSVWPGSMKIFEEFVDECIKKDFYLDENFLVRCLISIASHQAKFDKMRRIPIDKLKQSWEKTKRGIQNTITFLRNNAYVDSSAMLPSQNLLVPLVYYSADKNICETKESEHKFLYWFYNAAMWGRYSTSTETRLTQDLTALKNEKPWNYLIKNLWEQVGENRRPTVEDWRRKGVSSSFFFIMYVMARRKGSRDLETGQVINYTNFGKNNEIEYDHIFPKSKLEAVLKERIDASKRKMLINELCNFAFMTKRGNIIKTNDDPRDYFPKVKMKYGFEYFEYQQIPYDETLLDYDTYEKFLDERARLLVSATNEFLDALR